MFRVCKCRLETPRASRGTVPWQEIARRSAGSKGYSFGKIGPRCTVIIDSPGADVT